MRRAWSLMLWAVVVAVVAALAGSGPESAWSAPPPEEPATQPAARPGPPRGANSDGTKSWRRPPSDEEQEKEVLAYLQQKRPEIYKQMLSDRQKDPRRYRRGIRAMWMFLSRIKHLPEKVREAEESLQAARVKMWRLALQMHEMKDAAAKAGLERQLHELAEQCFAAEQIIREHRLTELAEQIQRIKAELKERAQDRQAIVQEMVERTKKGAAHYAEDRQRGPGTRPAEGPRPPGPGPDEEPRGPGGRGPE